MVQNKIVVRYQDGRTLKGSTGNFLPTKPVFHVTAIDALAGSKFVEVQIGEVKAIFFVRDHAGNAERRNSQEFPTGKPVVGRKIRVTFQDGETLVGTTQGYDPNRPGFFVIPADADSNNERCFVVTCATTHVAFI